MLMGVRDPVARARLIVAFRPLRHTGIDILLGEFDIMLG